MLCEKGVKATMKSNDPCQPAQTTQADMGQHFSQPLNFLHIIGQFYIMSRLFGLTKWILWIHNYVNREYVYSVAVYQKYITRLKELIIFEPWRENYHFSQPSYIFLIYDSTMYIFYLSFKV